MKFDKRLVPLFVGLCVLSIFVYAAATISAPPANSSIQTWLGYLNARIVDNGVSVTTNNGGGTTNPSTDNSNEVAGTGYTVTGNNIEVKVGSLSGKGYYSINCKKWGERSTAGVGDTVCVTVSETLGVTNSPHGKYCLTCSYDSDWGQYGAYMKVARIDSSGVEKELDCSSWPFYGGITISSFSGYAECAADDTGVGPVILRVEQAKPTVYGPVGGVSQNNGATIYARLLPAIYDTTNGSSGFTVSYPK